MQTSHQLVVATQLQERVHQAIATLMPGARTTSDDLLVVQALLITAATFAHAAAVEREAFVAQAGRHYDQIGAALASMHEPSAKVPASS